MLSNDLNKVDREDGKFVKKIPDLKEMLAKEARFLASLYSLMLFFKDFWVTVSSDMQQEKQLILIGYLSMQLKFRKMLKIESNDAWEVFFTYAWRM